MQQYFFIRMNGRYLKINFQEILYIEGCKNYLKIITENKTHLVLLTMKRLEQLLPVSLFRRVHKSFIVSLDKIIEFDADTVYLKNKQLPIGQLYKGELEKAVLIVNDTVNDALLTNAYYTVPMVVNGGQKSKFFEAG